jgi:hypothetical protein
MCRRQLFSKAAIAADSNANPSFSSFACHGSIEQRQLQPVDFQQAAARNPLQVAVQPGCRLDDAANLFLALRPQPHHCLALAVEVSLHVGEPFDDGLDPVPESRAGQVLIHHLSAGLLRPAGPQYSPLLAHK